MLHIISSLITVFLSFPGIYLQHLLYQTNCHVTLFKQKNRKNLQSVDLKKVFRRSFFHDPGIPFYLSDLSDRNYYPIRLIKCPTNAPPGVPIILPRSAIRIPTGTKALLYAPASTGAVAVPPTFAKDATAQVKISILITFARMTITATWIRRIRLPATQVHYP